MASMPLEKVVDVGAEPESCEKRREEIFGEQQLLTVKESTVYFPTVAIRFTCTCSSRWRS